MSIEDMAEVIGSHRDIALNHKTRQAVCSDCDTELGPMEASMDEQDQWLRLHVAEELSDAGYRKASEAMQHLDGSNAAVVSMMTGYSKSELDDLGGVPECASDLVDAALLEAAQDRCKGDSGVRHSLDDVAEEFGVDIEAENEQ